MPLPVIGIIAGVAALATGVALICITISMIIDKVRKYVNDMGIKGLNKMIVKNISDGNVKTVDIGLRGKKNLWGWGWEKNLGEIQIQGEKVSSEIYEGQEIYY